MPITAEHIRETIEDYLNVYPGEQRCLAPVLDLRQFLGSRLPEYMVPSSFTTLKTIPLTPNGKVDRRALPAPDYNSVDVDDAAPRNPREEIITGIWCDVLGVERVSVHDNFFHVGGHSLLATQVISRTNAACSSSSRRSSELTAAPTLRRSS